MSIPSNLRRHCGGAHCVEVQASTVADCLWGLVSLYPELKDQLFDERGNLHRTLHLFLGDDDLRNKDTKAVSLASEDELRITPAVSELSLEELCRYERHLTLPEVGVEGQTRLKAARVLLVGSGGLGSPLGLYLAAAGVGTIGIVDFDVVDKSNLQRQVLHGSKDLGRPKIVSACDRLQDLNPLIDIRPYPVALSAENALEILRDYDIVVDGTDNFATRYLVNDACVLLGKPYVYGSVFRFEGQVSVFYPAGGGPCYRCLYPEPPPPGMVPSCAEGGVLGVLPGVIGTLQATETIKLILGVGTSLLNRLLLFNALGMKFRELKVRRDIACPLCGPQATIKELIDYQEFCARSRTTPVLEEVTPRELHEGWQQGERPLLVDVREPYEWDIVNLSRYHAHLIPLSELEDRMSELDPEANLVVYCKSGGRSARAQRLLKEAGFHQVRNLSGGILQWADELDASMIRY